MPSRKVVSLALRLVVSGAFLFAGALKLQDPAGFAEQIANYQLLPEWSYWLAILFPPLELVAAVALLLAPRQWRASAALVIFAMLLAFTTALLRAWALDINLECGCFGKGSSEIGWVPVLRNLGLMTALALDFLHFGREPARPSCP